MRDQILDIMSRMIQSQENLQQIHTILTSWAKLPLFERKDGKRDALLNLDDREERCSKRYTEISSAGKQIIQLLEVI